jgi:hypothetical protein
LKFNSATIISRQVTVLAFNPRGGGASLGGNYINIQTP